MTSGEKSPFESLGKRYLNCSMPFWLRRQLGSGLLTPLAKAEAAPGETADARPTKAEDIDTALWCQALQRFHTRSQRPARPSKAYANTFSLSNFQSASVGNAKSWS